MKFAPLFSAVVLSTLLFSCGESKKEESNDSLSSASTAKKEDEKPAVNISYDELLTGKYTDQKVAVEGYFQCPSTFMTYDNSLSIYLYPRPDQVHGTYVSADIEMGTTPNTLRALGSNYTEDDLLVFSNTGDSIKINQRVKISGKVRMTEYAGKKSFTIDVEKVEKSEEVALDYEKFNAVQLTKENSTGNTLDEQLVYADGVIDYDVSILIPVSGSYMLDFTKSWYNGKVKIDIPVGTEEGQMPEVPEDFSQSDIKVLDQNAKPVGKKKVRVYGTYKYLSDFGILYAEEIVLVK